ncbi:hypothetical protein HPP92_015463 [Vanilla planifolia]|uniref:BPI/LBP family protein n=1 Tax=Vanilla planifolia TaxID=51239 RepID=A0A835UVU5_VANPL|nr:hypothetical protein HPP92_015463 [Vanilla planifolia]
MGCWSRYNGMFVTLLLLSLFSSLAASQLEAAEEGFISSVISEKGLAFAKDLLVRQAVHLLTRLRLPDIKKSVKIPLIGGLHISASNITLYDISVSSSTIRSGDTGILIFASGANASLSFRWHYLYSTWLLFPIEVSDEGSAFAQIKGLEVGLTTTLENSNGSLSLNITQRGCYVDDITIQLDGGASWFYQGFVYVFGNQIRSAVQNAIVKKITEGMGKLDSFLKALPKEIDVGGIAALNVSFVDDPVVGNASVEFDINGLFTTSNKTLARSYWLMKDHSSFYSVYCGNTLKMLGIAVDQAVFDSASLVLFEERLFHWIVDKVPDQSLLNTASWRFIIPQLYRKYPNEDMQLNISLTSAPVIKVSQNGFVATIFFDMTVEVLEDVAVPVACISVDFTVSGAAYVADNRVVSKADLKEFSLSLKWSKVGNFPMFLVQGVMRVLLNTVVMPYVNMHLRRGFPIPIFHGLTLQNSQMLTTNSKVILCSDLAFDSITAVGY